MRNRIARDSALSTTGVLVNGAARFLVSVLVGRLAGPASLATVNGGMAVATFASLLWPTAAGQAATKFVAREGAAGRAELVPALLRHLSARTMLSALVLAPCGAVVAMATMGVRWVEALWVAGLILSFAGYNFVRGVQFGGGRIARATAWEGISAIVTIALLVAVLVAGVSALYLAPLTVGYGVYAAAGWPRRGKSRPAAASEPTGRLPRHLGREIDGFVGWGVLGTVASTGLLQLSMVVAAATETGSQAGMYAAAISLATPASMLARSFSMVLFPAMARSTGRGDVARLGSQTDLATRALIIVMVPLFGLIALLAQPIVGIVYGTEYLAATPLLQILLLGVLLTTTAVAAVNALTAHISGGVRASALMSACGFAAGAAVMLAASSVWGVRGVAAGYLVGSFTSAALPLLYVWRVGRHRWAAPLARILLGTGLVWALVGIAPRLPDWWPFASAGLFTAAWVASNVGEVRRIRRLLAS